MVERMWFGSKLIGEGNGVVRLGPIAAVAEHGIDLCARGERRDTLTNLFDHSREITSGDRQGARAACRGLVGLVPLQFSGDDPCRVDAHQYLPWARMWLWRVFIHEVIWTATAMDTDRFHFLLSSRLRDESSPPPECGDQVNSLGCGSAEGEPKGLYARSSRAGRQAMIAGGSVGDSSSAIVSPVLPSTQS